MGLVSLSEAQNHHLLSKAHFTHTRPRARDHCISSTLIGGKRGAGPSSRHTTLFEGATEYVNGKMDVKSTWIPTWHSMDHVSWSLGLF